MTILPINLHFGNNAQKTPKPEKKSEAEVIAEIEALLGGGGKLVRGNGTESGAMNAVSDALKAARLTTVKKA